MTSLEVAGRQSVVIEAKTGMSSVMTWLVKKLQPRMLSTGWMFCG